MGRYGIHVLPKMCGSAAPYDVRGKGALGRGRRGRGRGWTSSFQLAAGSEAGAVEVASQGT